MSELSGLSYTERPRLPLVPDLNSSGGFPLGGVVSKNWMTESVRRESFHETHLETVVKIKVIIMIQEIYVCKQPRANSTIYSNT